MWVQLKHHLSKMLKMEEPDVHTNSRTFVSISQGAEGLSGLPGPPGPDGPPVSAAITT